MNDRPWIKNYDKGVPATIEYPKIPLFQLLENSAQKYPDRACTIFKGAVISYKEMSAITDRIAAALVAMGVKKGDRVGIFMPNTPQFVMAYFGILKAGGVVVATNPLYTPPEIEYQVNDSGVEIMFVMTNFYKTIKAAQPKTKIKKLIVTNIKETLPPVLRVLFTLAKEKKGGFRIEGGLAEGDIWFQDLLAKYANSPRPKLDIGPDDTALFQYSGGTTGVSKAAVATHFNVLADTLQIKSWMTNLVEGQEIVLMAIPLFHVYGMVAGMLFAMSTGASMVMIPNARDIPDVLENINKFHPTIFPGVPTLYNAINNHPDVKAGKYNLSSIKACISGSAPLLRETKETFERLSGGKVFEGFGLSEAPTATHCNPLNGVNKTGSIGMPLPDVDCKIINLDDGETEMSLGEIGEIVINGPQVMKGYHNMPTETANTLRTLKDGKVWLFTGDIGRMDEDGYFYIVDRKKELIKPGGYQVWPREVEEVLAANPKVMDVGVAGIPDPYRGETVKAWIVLKPGETATEEELKAFCKERLAAYKVPTHYEFRAELPKTTVGKILRRELVRQHKEAHPG
ncbi:MAG TPA: long-chain fatty acid--CoA ligase [Anaerolineales bacterium]|nr:long-chain fatty acid--CoA ligase [Anaerolineae bacterium]MBL1171004.1 long-chain fatty acid--CoA ligase [Chloroflexota bacterium]MDL1925004.1 long-chain fatty acid--CoA ligase [Anaerolineae bacterium AMX1]WKZ52940.1 MAG: long-chain fatty acid--CoA ligase [Anaerolineales bacterium]NOG74459.1 long-chain fatty acid--CoA ligase [Chloroflexota bacterium]